MSFLIVCFLSLVALRLFSTLITNVLFIFFINFLASTQVMYSLPLFRGIRSHNTQISFSLLGILKNYLEFVVVLPKITNKFIFYSKFYSFKAFPVACRASANYRNMYYGELYIFPLPLRKSQRSLIFTVSTLKADDQGRSSPCLYSLSVCTLNYFSLLLVLHFGLVLYCFSEKETKFPQSICSSTIVCFIHFCNTYLSSKKARTLIFPKYSRRLLHTFRHG